MEIRALLERLPEGDPRAVADEWHMVAPVLWRVLSTSPPAEEPESWSVLYRELAHWVAHVRWAPTAEVERIAALAQTTAGLPSDAQCRVEVAAAEVASVAWRLSAAQAQATLDRVKVHDGRILADAQYSFAHALRVEGRSAEAVPWMRRVHDARLEMFGANHPRTTTAYSALCWARAESGEDPHPGRTFETWWHALRASGPLHDQAGALAAVAHFAHAGGDYHRSAELLEQARALLHGVGPGEPLFSLFDHDMSCTLGALGRTEEAVRLSRRSLTLRREHLGHHHRRTRTTLAAFAQHVADYGALAEAREALSLLVALNAEVGEADTPFGLECRADVLALRHRLGEEVASEVHALLSHGSALLGDDHAMVQQLWSLRDLVTGKVVPPPMPEVPSDVDERDAATVATAALARACLFRGARDDARRWVESLSDGLLRAQVASSPGEALEHLESVEGDRAVFLRARCRAAMGEMVPSTDGIERAAAAWARRDALGIPELLWAAEWCRGHRPPTAWSTLRVMEALAKAVQSDEPEEARRLQSEMATARATVEAQTLQAIVGLEPARHAPHVLQERVQLLERLDDTLDEDSPARIELLLAVAEVALVMRDPSAVRFAAAARTLATPRTLLHARACRATAAASLIEIPSAEDVILARDAVAWFHEAHGPSHPESERARLVLGMVLRESGDRDAGTVLIESLEHSADNSLLPWVDIELGLVRSEQRQHARAVSVLSSARDHLQQPTPTYGWVRATCHLGRAHAAAGDLAQGAGLCREAMARAVELWGHASVEELRCREAVAWVLLSAAQSWVMSSSQHLQAIAVQEEVVEVLQRTRGADDPHTLRATAVLQTIRSARGRVATLLSTVLFGS